MIYFFAAIFKTSNSFTSSNVTTSIPVTIAQIDLTQYRGAYRINSMSIRVTLATAIRFDTLKLVIQNPSGNQFILLEKRCYGCVNGSLSLEFTSDATRYLPEQLCTSGQYLPQFGTFSLGTLNAPSSFGQWLLLASAGSNTTFEVLSANFELSIAQMSMSVGSTLCSQMVWISDSAGAISIPVGSGKERLLSVVVATQKGTTLLPSGYYNYTSPEIITSVESQRGAGIPCTANVQINVIGSNFVSLPPPVAMQLGQTICRATIWVSDTYALCRSQAQSVAIHKLGIKITVDSVVSNAVEQPDEVPVAWQFPKSVQFASSGGQIASIVGFNFGTVSNSASFRSFGTSVLFLIWHSDTSLSLKSCDAPRGPFPLKISLGYYLNESAAFSADFFASNTSILPPLSSISHQNVFKNIPTFPATGSSYLQLSGANLGSYIDYSESIRLCETASEFSTWFSYSHIVAKTPSGVQQFDRHDVSVSLVQQSRTSSSLWSYESPSFGGSNFLNVSLSYELIEVNGSNFGSSDLSPIAETLSKDHFYSILWSSDSSITFVLDKNMANAPYVPFNFLGGQNESLKAFAIFPNSRFYIPPINVSSVISTAFTTPDYMSLTRPNDTLSVQVGSFHILYLSVFVNSSYPATIRNQVQHVTEFVPVLLLDCKLEFVSSHIDFEPPCSGLPDVPTPCMLPPEKIAFLLFDNFFVSPCKISKPFRIKFSAVAFECLDTMCLSKRIIDVPLVAISPLIYTMETSFGVLNCTSFLSDSISIIATETQRQPIVFQVWGTGAALNCAATRVNGWLRLEPDGYSYAGHEFNSSMMLGSMQDFWFPFSAVRVSVYSSCNFTLPIWSVVKTGRYRFWFTLSSATLNATTEPFNVHPGPPSQIFLIGNIKSVMNGGDLIFSVNSTTSPPAIYLTVMDSYNNTVVSQITPTYDIFLKASDSTGKTYYFGGNVSQFSCSLDARASCSMAGVKAGLKTAPERSVSLVFSCGNARLLIGPFTIQNVGNPADTVFAAPPNVSSLVMAGQPLPLISLYIKDAGGNTFQLADLQKLSTANITVCVRVVVRRAPVLVSSRRMFSCEACQEETQDSCPGGGSYVQPLETGPDGSAICNLRQTIPCQSGTFLISYEIGFLDSFNTFTGSGISQYETTFVVEPGRCSYFGIRTVINKTGDDSIFNSSSSSTTTYAHVTAYTPVFDDILVYFLDDGFNAVAASINVSSSVFLTVTSPVRVQVQGSLAPKDTYSPILGRNITSAFVSGLIISVPFPSSKNFQFVNISGFSNSIQMVRDQAIVRVGYFCAPGTFLQCIEHSTSAFNSSNDLNLRTLGQTAEFNSTLNASACARWTCATCADGHVTNRPDLDVCQPCPAGMFANVNRSACLNCTGNTWSPAAFQQTSSVTNGNCIQCPMYFFAVADRKSCMGLKMMASPPATIVSTLPGVLPSMSFVDQNRADVNGSADIFFQLHCCDPNTDACMPGVNCNAGKTDQSPPFVPLKILSTSISMNEVSPSVRYVFQSFSFGSRDGLVAGAGYCWNVTLRSPKPSLVADSGWLEFFTLFPQFPVSFLGNVPIVYSAFGLSGSNISFSGGSFVTVYGQWLPDPKVPVNISQELCVFVSKSNNISKGFYAFRSSANFTNPPSNGARVCEAPEGKLFGVRF
jgi:hypothetical protein